MYYQFSIFVFTAWRLAFLFMDGMWPRIVVWGGLDHGNVRLCKLA
jgi:hypothetical protein